MTDYISEMDNENERLLSAKNNDEDYQ